MVSTQGNDFHKIKDRFERDAQLFDDIYRKDSGFNSWFNRNFRKPIYERFDIAMEAMRDVAQKKILDIGCGTGVYSLSLAAKGATDVVGVDFSNEMIDIAKRRANECGLASHCNFMTQNFLELPAEKKYHYSFAMGVFDYLVEPIPFLKKMREVSIDKVIASFPSPSLIRQPLRRMRYLLTGRGDVYYYTKTDIEKLTQDAGFTRYQLVPIKTGSGYVLIAHP